MHTDPEFLSPTALIDSDHPEVRALAESLRGFPQSQIVREIFEFVRDKISHPADTGGTAMTVSASEVLREREGVCFAQAHLLVALYRAAGIPAALRYQQVDTETGQSVLHGIVAVWAPYLSETGGFILMDPRFPENHLYNSGHEWQTRALQLPFERNLPELYADVPPTVADALREATDAQEFLRSGLPAGRL